MFTPGNPLRRDSQLVNNAGRSSIINRYSLKSRQGVDMTVDCGKSRLTILPPSAGHLSELDNALNDAQGSKFSRASCNNSHGTDTQKTEVAIQSLVGRCNISNPVRGRYLAKLSAVLLLSVDVHCGWTEHATEDGWRNRRDDLTASSTILMIYQVSYLSYYPFT